MICVMEAALFESSKNKLTSWNHSRRNLRHSSDVMRVVLKCSGSDPFFVILSQNLRDELELYHKSFWCPGNKAVLILSFKKYNKMRCYPVRILIVRLVFY